MRLWRLILRSLGLLVLYEDVERAIETDYFPNSTNSLVSIMHMDQITSSFIYDLVASVGLGEILA